MKSCNFSLVSWRNLSQRFFYRTFCNPKKNHPYGSRFYHQFYKDNYLSKGLQCHRIHAIKVPGPLKNSKSFYQKVHYTTSSSTANSLGMLIDPYLGYHKLETETASFLSVEGIQAKWTLTKSKLATGVSFGHIKKFLPSFDVRKFCPQAEKIFCEFLDAHERGDLRKLTNVCTDDLYLNIKHELKKISPTKNTIKSREKVGKSSSGVRKVFKFLSFTGKTLIVHGRHTYQGKQGSASGQGYGQVTVVVKTRREEFWIDGLGRRVANAGKIRDNSNKKSEFVSSALQKSQLNTGEIFENECICVFEANFQDPMGRWRLAALHEGEKVNITNSGGPSTMNSFGGMTDLGKASSSISL